MTGPARGVRGPRSRGARRIEGSQWGVARPARWWLGAILLTALLLYAREGRAEWRRNADVVFNTAYTLQEGTLAMGLLGPLDIGVSDTLQVGLHPILLLVGKPAVALRYRVSPVSAVTFALSAGATWSFIDRVDREGRETEAGAGGFPGSAHLTLLMTTELGRDLILTGGAGLGADFLGDQLVRGLVPLQLGLHWRADPAHLVMVQALAQWSPAEGTVRRPSLQALYGLALTPVMQVTVGLSLGPLAWQTDTGTRTIALFPLADLWFRF
jgi:hypothetical protein